MTNEIMISTNYDREIFSDFHRETTEYSASASVKIGPFFKLGLGKILLHFAEFDILGIARISCVISQLGCNKLKFSLD